MARVAWGERDRRPGGSGKACFTRLEKKPKGPSAHYFGALLALLHELDPQSFKKEIVRLQRERLNPFHEHTVNLMSGRIDEQVYGMIGADLPVYIADDVDEPELVFRYLESWCQTRDLALDGITRLDVIVLLPSFDFLGLYQIRFDGIVLTWKNKVGYGFGRLWRKFGTELTFYHEVGHHYHQHEIGGQVDEQEREADDYKFRMFANAHPTMVFIGRIIFSPLLLYLWMSNRASKKRGDLDV